MSVSDATRTQVDSRFPRDKRLLKPAEFTRVFREGIRSADRFFTVLATRNDLEHPRIGMAVSRKVSPRAVRRNRIKRQVRETFRLTADDLPCIDIVVMARRDVAQADNEQIRHSLASHWQRLIRKCNGS